MSELGQKLIERVRHHASENDGFVYRAPGISNDGRGPVTSCLYMHGDQPGCLIGHALFDAGVIDSLIPKGLNEYTSVANIAAEMGLGLDSTEVNWLSDVQDFQDRGYAWGYAVHRADGT